MNFKTTLILILLLGAAGIYLITTRDSGEESAIVKPPSETLLGIEATDVSKLTVKQADGTATTFEKSGGEWKMTAPVAGPADRTEVDGLVRQITELKSRGANDTASGTGV